YMRVTDDQHCWTYRRCARCRRNQAGANLNRDKLHDELQQCVCQLPNDMRPTGTSSKHVNSRHLYPQQCCFTGIVHLALHKSTATMFTNVLTFVSLAMILSQRLGLE